MKKLVLFIHGLGGDAAGTWLKFPDLIKQDPELRENYDAESVQYPTGKVGSQPSLATCAAILKNRNRQSFLGLFRHRALRP